MNRMGERQCYERLTRRETDMGGLLALLMKSLLRTTLLKGALERRARNLYSCGNKVECLHMSGGISEFGSDAADSSSNRFSVSLVHGIK